MSKRRGLLSILGAGVLAAPLDVFAQQQAKVWRVGFLAERHVDFVESDNFYGAFRGGLREFGYVDGKNLLIEWRSAEGYYERLPALAAGLVDLKVDVIVTASTRATDAARKATTAIPIVMGSVTDPVGSGFVKSLARPGGNITGVTNMTRDLVLKRLEMMLAIVPKLSRVAVLVNSSSQGRLETAQRIQAEGNKRGLTILLADARTPQEIDAAFAWMRQQNVGALIVLLNPLFAQQKSQIAALAGKYRLPATAPDRMYTELGILMSYGPSLTDQWWRVATYVVKILKGAQPGELPVEQPTKFDLVINGGTAKALGLTIPYALRISTTKVIE